MDTRYENSVPAGAQSANAQMLTKQMFRLLPIQVLLAAVGAVNNIVSSLFAANSVGVNAMSAVALYAPITTLLGALSTMMVGGTSILCGKYMGRNENEKTQNVFSLDLIISGAIGALFTAAILFAGITGAVGMFTNDPLVQPYLREYLLGQAIGVLPFMLGGQLAPFLTLENKPQRTMLASVIYIIVNVVLNFLFVQVLKMEAFGLALASSLGMWVFFGVQLQHFLTKKAHFHFSMRRLFWRESGEIVKVGIPGALNTGYQTVRGLIVNMLLGTFVGSAGLSAFGACNNLLGLFWAIPGGMLAVSRLMISVSEGEEDRQTLTDVMRVMIRKYTPLMCIVSAVIIALAVPLTELFYRDPSQSVYMMTVWGFRLLPVCMPLAIFSMHFECYGQISGKQVLVHVTCLLDGVICVAGFAALLIPLVGMNGIYYANILNGVVVILVFIAYAWIKNRHFPKRMDELMVVPAGFGAREEERMDLTIRNIEDVVSISQRVQEFCINTGVDERRAYLSGLCLEEMAGNIVDHGFTKDRKKHSVDVRVVRKGEDVILRIRDDCVPFDPGERQKIVDPDDITKNMGIRMVTKIAQDIQHQNILGMNVLTMRI